MDLTYQELLPRRECLGQEPYALQPNGCGEPYRYQLIREAEMDVAVRDTTLFRH